MQGDECAEQDALRLKEQLDGNGSAKLEVEGQEITVMPNMVDIKKESRSGGYMPPALALPYYHLTMTPCDAHVLMFHEVYDRCNACRCCRLPSPRHSAIVFHSVSMLLYLIIWCMTV